MAFDEKKSYVKISWPFMAIWVSTSKANIPLSLSNHNYQIKAFIF